MVKCAEGGEDRQSHPLSVDYGGKWVIKLFFMEVYVKYFWWMSFFVILGKSGEISDSCTEEGTREEREGGRGEKNPGARWQCPWERSRHDDGWGPGNQEGGRTQEGQSIFTA